MKATLGSLGSLLGTAGAFGEPVVPEACWHAGVFQKNPSWVWLETGLEKACCWGPEAREEDLTEVTWWGPEGREGHSDALPLGSPRDHPITQDSA